MRDVGELFDEYALDNQRRYRKETTGLSSK
jgi:hypothetical protein